MTKLVRNPIDAFVGGQIKLRRAVVGMSQTELANRLGITFQQVQKYEKGANRVGGSRLYEISKILNVGVQDFYVGVESVIVDGPEAYHGATNPTIERYEEFIRSPGGIDLCKAFVDIDDTVLRKRITALVKTCAEVSRGVSPEDDEVEVVIKSKKKTKKK